MGKRLWIGVILSSLAVGLWIVQPELQTTLAVSNPDWPQWAQNPQHTGFLNAAGQSLSHILADIVYDPLVHQEQTQSGGDLLVHYQTPLVDGNDVYMESKSGGPSLGTYGSEFWHQNKFSWVNGQLTKIWTFDSDWKPPGSQMDFWEPVYHAALANGFVYDPGAGGTILKLSKADGSVVTRLNPFASIDSLTFTVSPLTVDANGNIYYNVLKLTTRGPFYSRDAADSWLVKVAPDDTISKVSYSALLQAATIIGDPVPGNNDPCKVQFPDNQLPWPPRLCP